MFVPQPAIFRCRRSLAAFTSRALSADSELPTLHRVTVRVAESTTMASIYKPFHFHVSADVPLELKVYIGEATLPSALAAALAPPQPHAHPHPPAQQPLRRTQHVAAAGPAAPAPADPATTSARDGCGGEPLEAAAEDGASAAANTATAHLLSPASAQSRSDAAGAPNGSGATLAPAVQPAHQSPIAPSAAIVPATVSLGVAAALHPEALFLTVQAVDGGVPLHSAARATQLPYICGDRLVWNEWLALPVKIRDLPLTAQLVRHCYMRCSEVPSQLQTSLSRCHPTHGTRLGGEHAHITTHIGTAYCR